MALAALTIGAAFDAPKAAGAAPVQAVSILYMPGLHPGDAFGGDTMRYYSRTTVAVVASAMATVAAHASLAQSAANSTQTDARWYAWLGCWAAESATGGAKSASPSVTCIVPVANSHAVEVVTIVGGTVVTRDHLDANGKAHPIDGQGCKGTETASWSASGHRVYLHAAYTCAGGTPGTSATILAFTPSGEFLRVEQVRSGGGSLVSTDRLHETGTPSAVSADAARSIERQARAVTTARAAAALPITSEEIIEANRSLDADVVRSWVVESDQQFDSQQVATLTRAGVSPIVLQAIAGQSARSQMAMSNDSARAAGGYANYSNYSNAPSNADVYNSSSQPMTTMYRCPPDGCYSNQYSAYNGYGYPSYGYAQPLIYPYGYAPYFYSTPIIIRRGVNRVEFRGPPRPVRPPVVHAPPARPRGPSGRRP